MEATKPVLIKCNQWKSESNTSVASIGGCALSGLAVGLAGFCGGWPDWLWWRWAWLAFVAVGLTGCGGAGAGLAG